MVHGQPSRQKRTQYIIHKRFQLKYMGVILLISIFIMLIASATVYLTSYKIMKEKMANVYPQSELVPILRHTHVILGRNLILLIPIIVVMAVYLSHKIAGPLYRIEKSIKEIGSGNLDLKVSLRQGDEFKEIAEALNDMTKTIKETRMKEIMIVEKVKSSTRDFLASLDQRKSPVDPKEFARLLQDEVEKLETIISRSPLA